jgi:hypothetical protein
MVGQNRRGLQPELLLLLLWQMSIALQEMLLCLLKHMHECIVGVEKGRSHDDYAVDGVDIVSNGANDDELRSMISDYA